MTENEIGKIIVDKAIQLHREMGPGLLESVYEIVLAHELELSGLEVSCQVSVPIKYKDIIFDEAFRADIVVENMVILELKSVKSVSNVHKKQLLTYLKLANLKLGYLLNFGEELMVSGITRIVNEL